MTPPQQPASHSFRPKSPSPAERSVEFADHQRRLKEEAAERRLQAQADPTPEDSPRRRRLRP